MKRDQDIMEFNHSILESILLFICHVKDNSNDVPALTSLLRPFIKHYPINCKIVKNVLSVLIKDFYQEHFSHQLLRTAIGLLKVIVSQQKREEGSPGCYFLTCG